MDRKQFLTGLTAVALVLPELASACIQLPTGLSLRGFEPNLIQVRKGAIVFAADAGSEVRLRPRGHTHWCFTADSSTGLPEQGCLFTDDKANVRLNRQWQGRSLKLKDKKGIIYAEVELQSRDLVIYAFDNKRGRTGERIVVRNDSPGSGKEYANMTLTGYTCDNDRSAQCEGSTLEYRYNAYLKAAGPLASPRSRDLAKVDLSAPGGKWEAGYCGGPIQVQNPLGVSPGEAPAEEGAENPEEPVGSVNPEQPVDTQNEGREASPEQNPESDSVR